MCLFCCSYIGNNVNIFSHVLHSIPLFCALFQVLRVLANIAHKKKEFGVQLAQLGLLSALCATLKMANQEMVTLSMDVLFMLVVSGPQVN